MQCAHDPLYDIHPAIGVSIEVFYADRTLETFGRGGAGWFWRPRRGQPFATSYATYRHALQRVGLSVPRSDECAFRDGRQPRAPNAENHGGGINAVSSSCWGACSSDFLSEIRRSGGGTRTPDPRIMIPVLAYPTEFNGTEEALIFMTFKGLIRSVLSRFVPHCSDYLCPQRVPSAVRTQGP
jgi:hypothetical protein